MSRRAFTGLIVLLCIVGSILYIWKPWSDEPSLKLGLDLQGGLRVTLQAEEENPTPEDLDSARSVIENRVNEFGVSEPVIQTSGNRRILVELPGLSSADQDRALDLIGQQAILEFRLVRPESAGKADVEMTSEDLEDVAFTGEIISNAQADFNRVGNATVGGTIVLFDVKGPFQAEFSRFTGNNLGRRMAIVLDGKVMSAPQLNGAISSSGQIEGFADLTEAGDLALVLRSGSLPINLKVEEIRAIGPTLGADSIAAGWRAAMIGGGAVVLAILLFYGPLFGGTLTFGLVLVMLFIFGILAMLKAVITLPGLAGLVLTIGAAVDGNVISFERIKEELRAGKGLRVAMKNGFQQSLSAIIDANVTTLIAAAALYQYTSGPVRGFAITLAIGIICAVFVNIVVVPFLLDIFTARSKRSFMPQGSFRPNFKFIENARPVMITTALIALAALALVSVRGFNFSTDFTGGSSMLYNVNDTTTVNDVRSAIDNLALTGISGSAATVQEVIDNTIEGKQIAVRVGTIEGSDSANQLPLLLADKLQAELLQADFVGPAVGGELRSAALMAILVALVLILIYVAVRFWPNWIVAVGAIVATVHDVCITLGINNLFGAEFSIPVLAALLFVVGYSLNDSIIIADRIRENLKKTRGYNYADIVNASVNQTLSRTIVTSGTTLLPALALFFFGGSVLRDFSLTLLAGIAVGTYSSIFILAPIVVWFKNRQRTSGVGSSRRPA
ncbi:MAG: protein translocase subunit SecD [Deinococcales bacterium]